MKVHFISAVVLPGAPFFCLAQNRRKLARQPFLVRILLNTNFKLEIQHMLQMELQRKLQCARMQIYCEQSVGPRQSTVLQLRNTQLRRLPVKRELLLPHYASTQNLERSNEAIISHATVAQQLS